MGEKPSTTSTCKYQTLLNWRQSSAANVARTIAVAIYWLQNEELLCNVVCLVSAAQILEMTPEEKQWYEDWMKNATK